MLALRAPATTLVDSERARPPRSPEDYVFRAHGASRRERPPTPSAPEARGAQRGLREPCGIEDPAGSRRDTPATRRTKARKSQPAQRSEQDRLPVSRDAEQRESEPSRANGRRTARERPRAFRMTVPTRLDQSHRVAGIVADDVRQAADRVRIPPPPGTSRRRWDTITVCGLPDIIGDDPGDSMRLI